MQYMYSIARFVPDPARGECINLGLLVGSDETSEWTLRTVESLRRANKLDEKRVVPQVVRHLAVISARLDRFESSQELVAGDEHVEPVSILWLRNLARDSANVLQFSEPMPVVADSVEDAVDALWDELIVEPTARRFRFLKKYRAVTAVHQAMRHLGIAQDRVLQRAQVRGSSHESRMDFVVHNGRVSQLTNCWSFQLPNKAELMEEIKAWCWTMQDLREGGGEAVGSSDERFAIERNVSISVVYVPPQESGDVVLQEARVAFEKLHADVVPYDDPQSVTERALRLDA